MDAKTFSKKLKEIKAEVLALKQAHEYGLGRADFPFRSKTISYNENDTIKITVEFNDNVANKPYMQFYMQADSQYFSTYLPSGSWSNHTYTIYKTMPVTSQSYIGVVATMPIKDFSVEIS